MPVGVRLSSLALSGEPVAGEPVAGEPVAGEPAKFRLRAMKSPVESRRDSIAH